MTIERLSELYNKKYPNKRNLNVKDIQEYSISNPLDAGNILSLYKLRNDIYKEKKKVDSINFKNLINALESYKEQQVVMHVFNIHDKPHMVLTNVEFTEVIAEL